MESPLVLTFEIAGKLKVCNRLGCQRVLVEARHRRVCSQCKVNLHKHTQTQAHQEKCINKSTKKTKHVYTQRFGYEFEPNQLQMVCQTDLIIVSRLQELKYWLWVVDDTGMIYCYCPTKEGQSTFLKVGASTNPPRPSILPSPTAPTPNTLIAQQNTTFASHTTHKKQKANTKQSYNINKTHNKEK